MHATQIVEALKGVAISLFVEGPLWRVRVPVVRLNGLVLGEVAQKSECITLRPTQRGFVTHGPAILLLSATPYRPPAGGVDVAGMSHYDQFFRLLEFLYGAEARTEVPALRLLFRRYGTLLREAVPGSNEVLRLRDDIQSRLFRVIARTERAGLLGAQSDATSPERRSVDLRADDVRVYRHLWASAGDDDRSAVTPYWSSIPYPLQMMDQRYLLRKRATPAPIRDVAASPLVLGARQVRHYEDVAPPHPRMRALLSEVAGPMLGLPWLPPSLPWWSLGSPFKDAADSASVGGLSKILLFSRFRAVPRAVASLISFESERRVYTETRRRGRIYDYHARRRGGRDEESAPESGLDALPAPSFNWQSRQRESGDRELDHSLLSLFVPAPRLGEIGNPQRIAGFARGDLRRVNALESVTADLRAMLAGLSGGDVRVGDGGRTGQAWRALTRVAGFQTWRTMGRFVRKGEKGIAIMAPIIGRREAESEGDNARTVRGFRAAYVFDVEQTDGEPLPTPIEASGDPGARTALLKTVILEQGIAIEYADELGGAPPRFPAVPTSSTRCPACCPGGLCLRYRRTGCASVTVRPASVRQSRASGGACCHAYAKAPPLRRRAPSSCPDGRPVMVGSSWICEGTTHHGSQEDKMATTATTTPNQPVTYSLLVIFTVDPSTDEHLQDQQSIRDEAESWLASLDATVHGVNIRKAD